MAEGRIDEAAQVFLDFAEKHPGRITAAVRTKGGVYAENRRGYFKMLEREVGSGRFGAIAELLLYHAKKGNKADEIVVYPDDQRVRATLQAAARMGWPLVVHIEFAAISGTVRSVFMDQLESLLALNTGCAFAMIHMGQLGREDVGRLIESHGNIYFMTSHTNPAAIGKSDQPWTPMFEGEVLAPGWRELVVRHPERFVLAFDNVWPEHWGEFYLREAEYWRKALADLPHEVAQAVAHGNAERLWKIPTK